jgi:copper chaperone
MQELNFEVGGLTCQGCVRTVTRAIQTADAEAEVDVNLETHHLQALTVLSAPEIQTQIEGAGYTARFIDAV